MALSTDGWSNTNNESFINFMLASPDMKPVFWKSIATGEEEHSGVYIASCINDVINEVETAIGAPGRICSVVTDNAKTMLTAWTELKKMRPTFSVRVWSSQL
ncbi:Acetate kinase [Phytophthora nicotianae]|uniref:Acetate kinase n=1 Tax=Phytophthora nicotianae TaxID=4792 RepID=A0A0W8CTF7_PHYNI|nr:Acetate kinase [Phytophthora nicotianae]